MSGGKPEGQVQNNARKETSLRDAEQKAKCIEAVGAGRKCGGSRYDAPCHHDPGDPQPHTNPMEDEIGGHLEQEVAQKENAAAEAEYGGRQTNRLVHTECGEPHIDAVEKADEVQQHHERKNAPTYLAYNPDFQAGGHGFQTDQAIVRRLLAVAEISAQTASVT